MKSRLILPILISLLGACADDTVQVRACNQTTSDFDVLETQFFNGALAVDACTPYVVSTDPIYKFTYVKLTIGSQILEIQPLDFVGVPQLTSGHWTFRIDSLDLAANTFVVAAIEDQSPDD